MGIILKTEKQIETIRRSGQAATATLQRMGEAVRPGIATSELDRIARKMIRDFGGTSSFLGYRPTFHPPFPATICASINDEIVHGIPSPRRKVGEGDILSLDFAMIIDGYHGDTAFTFPVGRVSPEAQRLLDVTRASVFKGIEEAKPGNRIGDIGHAVQQYAESYGYSVVRDLCGHGIGRSLWEEPQVPNHGRPQRGIRLKPGMVIAIEPMVCAGAHRIRILDDEWTTSTADGRLSAHFEHTVAILSDGPEILTENTDLWGSNGLPG
ncbi:MAG: type I methionyl aminopeptidase [Gemmatimonadetes bacterium]|nr:type I methionyl aminopeptidase [Gemmatimonadota bacterium]MYB59865.1 type I methionyl aminopeptidase [Gemmatimonadota bacterium]